MSPPRSGHSSRGRRGDDQARRAKYFRDYAQRPEVKARRAELRRQPEAKAAKAEYDRAQPRRDDHRDKSHKAEYDRRYRQQHREKLKAQSRVRSLRYYHAHSVHRQYRDELDMNMPWRWFGHPALERARRLIEEHPQWERSLWRDDLIAEGVLAIYEGRSPQEAIAAYHRKEMANLFSTRPINADDNVSRRRGLF